MGLWFRQIDQASSAGGMYALLGALGGVLAITVAGTVAAKKRGDGQQ